jgi:hypothetical protein
VTTDKKKISAYLTHDLEARAKSLAASKQMSLSTFVAYLLSREVEAHEGTTPASTQEPSVLPAVQLEAPELPQAAAAVKSEPAKETKAPVLEDDDEDDAVLYTPPPRRPRPVVIEEGLAGYEPPSRERMQREIGIAKQVQKPDAQFNDDENPFPDDECEPERNFDDEYDEDLERKKEWELNSIKSQFSNNPAKLKEKIAEWREKYAA